MDDVSLPSCHFWIVVFLVAFSRHLRLLCSHRCLLCLIFLFAFRVRSLFCQLTVGTFDNHCEIILEGFSRTKEE